MFFVLPFQNAGIMKQHRQVINEQQQPGGRNYRRERRQYERDEERDFYEGSDYLRDWDPRDVIQPWEHLNQRQYSERLYTPRFDYGYWRDEYHGRDDYRHPAIQDEMEGYRNYRSQQERDFESWLQDAPRYRNFNEQRVSHPRFNSRDEDHNRYFEEGRYDYSNHSPSFERDVNRGGERHYDRYHNRSDRHLEIVVPFKDQDDYSQNDYNHSEGFGSNEMVYHGDGRRGRW
jgi:hypothetical protein